MGSIQFPWVVLVKDGEAERRYTDYSVWRDQKGADWWRDRLLTDGAYSSARSAPLPYAGAGL